MPRQPSRYSRPPIIMVLPARFGVLFKDGYGMAIRATAREPGEIIRRVYQKATTPRTFAFYENAIDDWASGVSEEVSGSVEEYWLPVTDEDVIYVEGLFEIKPNLTNTVWNYVVAKDYRDIDEIIEFLLLKPAKPTEEIGLVDWGEDVPEMIKRLPPLPPEQGERFKPYQYEAIEEIAEELSINKTVVNRRIREGKTIRNYQIAIGTDIPPISLKALNRNISLDQLYGDERVTKQERKKINKLAASYGVSGDYFIKVARGQRPLTKRFK